MGIAPAFHSIFQISFHDFPNSTIVKPVQIQLVTNYTSTKKTNREHHPKQSPKRQFSVFIGENKVKRNKEVKRQQRSYPIRRRDYGMQIWNGVCTFNFRNDMYISTTTCQNSRRNDKDKLKCEPESLWRRWCVRPIYTKCIISLLCR